MALLLYARGNGAQYPLHRRMGFPKSQSGYSEKDFLAFIDNQTPPAKSLVSTLTELPWTQDAFLNVPNHDGTTHDWLFASEEQLCNWCQRKRSGKASSLTFILWASLSQRLSLVWPFVTVWRVHDTSVTIMSGSTNNRVAGPEKIHIPHQMLRHWTPHHAPTIHKTCFVV